ncbi:MAG: CAAX prenyl protease-related protein, partial [Burkholderiaceae bacterium]
MVSRTTLSRILPFATYIFFMFFADVLANLGWGEQELRWLYAAKISAVVAVLWFFRHDYVELRLPFNANLHAWGMPLATGAVVFVAWVNLNADWMVIGASTGFDPQGKAGNSWELIFIRLAGAALVVPIMEELFWRSF